MIQTVMEQWLALIPGALPQSPQSPQYPGGAAVPDRHAGRPAFVAGSYQSGDGELRYKLFIPGSYAGEQMPLLVMLHGWGQTADDFADGTGMNDLAEKHGWLVLYPERSAFGYGGCWNWFDRAHQQRGSGDPALIAATTRAVMASHAVAPGRVFIAGMSAGGAMAVVMGRTYPDLFAAVGCHSGLPHACATDSASALHVMRHGAVSPGGATAQAGPAVPVIVFHGDDDATVNLANGASVVRESLAAAGLARPPVRLEASATGFGRSFTRAVHRKADGIVVAEHWVIHGAGHAWSGGNGRGSFTDPQGPPASAEMLRFFLQV
ncbi:extracellular catalytic domain type 1 short-chain-length polyhydroxyalkanoate depolymerase [Pseudoduganella umbonata]|nr:PHB depolymerase family esterase [Pseudoduganella umbonata]QCP14555.1 PHB depolymerase family esterase [Pseudoduganella umbonata]